MGLHRLTRIAVGVPNVGETARYYTEFGLTPTGTGFATTDGGEQLEIRHSPPMRRTPELRPLCGILNLQNGGTSGQR